MRGQWVRRDVLGKYRGESKGHGGGDSTYLPTLGRNVWWWRTVDGPEDYK